MIIGIDFDGTVVTHEYPKIGIDVGAVSILRKLAASGHKLILWTMRDGVTLQEAVNWFMQNGITLFGVNENPEQSSWTNSPKAYCNLYIDDAALGIPLILDKHERPYVDWTSVKILLENQGIL